MISHDRPTPSRVLVVGLDGATFDLIEPWAAEGKLPTLAHLMAEGTHGLLRSVIPPITMPAWSSFLTGMLPGHHGIYSFLRRKPDSYDLTPFNASYLQMPDLGTLLNQVGRRVASVNVPATYPPKPLDGLVVTGLETPSRDGRFTHPPSLGQALVERFDYEIEPSEMYNPGQENSFMAAVERSEGKRLEATLWLLDQVDWDLFVVVFRGTDLMAHAFWRFMDPSHPAHEPNLAQRYGEALLQHYQQMDHTIAALKERVGPETALLLMSDHGVGPLHREVYIDNLLAEHGLLHIKQTPTAQLRSFLLELGVTPRNLLHLLALLRLLNLTRKLLPQKARVAVNLRMLMQNSVDWSRTKAYPLYSSGQIAINLKGREPRGIIEPGAEYNQVCAEVEHTLHTLRDPGTRQPMVKRVWHKRELYGSDAVPELPDLYVEWINDAYADLGAIGYSRGIVSEPIRGRSGGHTMRGIFLAHGPGIKRGYTVKGACLIDLAPTIMHLLGAAVPAHMDGKVLVDIWDDEQTVVYDSYESTPFHRKEVHVFSDQDQATVEERLRNLGYI
jgi:predicted AlkP superfamily phosphohydrolase/phosphomutase